jgi:hypothetical protein
MVSDSPRCNNTDEQHISRILMFGCSTHILPCVTRILDSQNSVHNTHRAVQHRSYTSCLYNRLRPPTWYNMDSVRRVHMLSQQRTLRGNFPNQCMRSSRERLLQRCSCRPTCRNPFQRILQEVLPNSMLRRLQFSSTSLLCTSFLSPLSSIFLLQYMTLSSQ